jgi:hypothetical protein
MYIDYIVYFIGHIREILMCYVSTVGERVEEHVVSCKLETCSMMIHKINFHLSPYEFEIGLYVNFEKLWNIKFQAK